MRLRLESKCLSVAATAAALAGSLALGEHAARGEAVGTPSADMQKVLDALLKLDPKPITMLAPARARTQPSASDAVVQVLQDAGNAAPERLPSVGRVESKAFPGPDGTQLPVRIYTPKGHGPFPVIVYFHGGGWVIATNDTYDASARGLTDSTSAVVVAVEYRKAPEHKFPAATEDAYAALQYVTSHASELEGDPKRVAVVGESAGGNLATVACLLAKQRGGAMPVHQVLVYPVTDAAFDSVSYRANADAKPLNAPMMKWFFQNYLGNPADGRNVLVSPLRATTEQLRGLPPATVVTAEIDPLREDGRAYAAKLKAAGVERAAHDYPGVTHEFFGMSAVVDGAKLANAFVAERLKAAFSNAVRPADAGATTAVDKPTTKGAP